MAMYQCKFCEDWILSGHNHKCNPKPVPFNVVMTDEDKEKMKVTLYTSHKGKELFLQGKAFEACTETIRAHMLEIKVSEKHIQHKLGNMRVIAIGSDAVFV